MTIIQKVRSKNVFSRSITFLIVFSMLFSTALPKAYAADLLNIHMIDVGQGDAIFIQYQSYEILIDAGENNMGSRVADYVKPKLKGNLDLVIATHPDSDHIGGMDIVLSQLKVDKIIDSGMSYTTQTYKDYWSEVGKQVKNGAVYLEDSDMNISLGNGLKLEVIETGDDNGSKNNNSVLSKLSFGKVSILLTGDMESEVEEKILTRNLQADMLKAGHHGSRSSSSASFIEKVAPQCTLISAGLNNKYGHPHPETISNFESRNILYYVTSNLGDIVVATDGNTFTVEGKTYTGHSDGTVIDNPGDGTTTPTDPGTTTPTTPNDIKITNIDPKVESVSIKNSSDKAVDLSGWYVLSTVGGQSYSFPDNYKIEAGQTVKIVSGSAAKTNSENALVWTKAYVWSDSYDPGELYNEKNVLVSSFGVAE
jgi:competence protein ComEC